MKVVVTVLFIIIVVGIVIIWTFHEGRSKKHIGNDYFDFISKNRVFNVYSEKDEVKFSGIIRVTDCDNGKVKNCFDEVTQSDYCFIFGDGAIFRFNLYHLGENKDVHCADLIWENMQIDSHTYTDCFDIDYGYWYGLPNFVGPFWPLQVQGAALEDVPYRPHSEEKLGHILEGLWINSNGIAITSHQNVPIKVSLKPSLETENDKKLCISLNHKAQRTPSNSFNYSVCSGPNIKRTFTEVRNTYFPKTAKVDFGTHDFANILWKYENKGQTSAGFGRFLDRLNSLLLPIQVVQCDSDWEEFIGNFKYRPRTRDEFAQYLKGKYSNTKLILPVTLACSYLSENFKTGAKNNLFAMDWQTGAMKMVLYDDQSCALWDTSNPEGRKFLQDAMNSLQQKGTLEETEYPHGFEFQSLVNSRAFPISLFDNTSDVNAINIDFAQFLLSINKTVLMQSAFHMQNLTIFVEIPTEVANMSGKKCLDYVIPAALTAGIHGYPYVMTTAPSEDQVDHELYMRWLQIAVYFPGLKVTNAVVKFEGQTAALAKNLSKYREEIVVPILRQAVEDVSKGFPLIRPLWWMDPSDSMTFRIADQFLLGDVLMVAPVLCHGDRQRDIYLPAGQWIDTNSRVVYSGQRWLRDFEVSLYDTAVFELIVDNSFDTVTDN